MIRARIAQLTSVAAGAAIAVVLTASPAAAASITFNFTNNSQGGGSSGQGTDGNSRTWSSLGLTVVGTAWSVDTSRSTDVFANAALGLWSGNGLGVCNDSEGSNHGCDSPDHQVDNYNNYKDFVLFLFSQPVDVSKVHIRSYGDGENGNNDLDVNYWFGNTANLVNLSGVYAFNGLAALGFSPMQSSYVNASNSDERDVTINGGPQFGNALLFGARVDSNDDYFKIQSLTVDQPIHTPEPGTILLMGSGLLAAARRLKKRPAQA